MSGTGDIMLMDFNQQLQGSPPLDLTRAATPEAYPDLLSLEERACLDALFPGEDCLQQGLNIGTPPEFSLHQRQSEFDEAQSSHASHNLFEEVGDMEVNGMEVPLESLDMAGFPARPNDGGALAHSIPGDAGDADLLNWARMHQEGCGSSATNHHVSIADFIDESSPWADHRIDTTGHIIQGHDRSLHGLNMGPPVCTPQAVPDVYMDFRDVLMEDGDGLLLSQGMDGLPGIVPNVEYESDSERQAIHLGSTLDKHMEEFLQVMGVENCQELVQLATESAPTPDTEKRIDVKVTKALLELRHYTLGIYARRYLLPGGEGLQGGQALARKMLCESLEAFFLEKLKTLACKCWGLLHFKYPFPDANIKKKLSLYSDRTSRQVNDWFTNWRARSWKPIFLRARRRLMKVSYVAYALVVLRKHFQEKRTLRRPDPGNAHAPGSIAMDLDC